MGKRLLITLLTEIRIHVEINGGQEMNQSQRQGFRGSHNNRFDILELNLGTFVSQLSHFCPL